MAAALVNLLVESFPCFRDEFNFEGKKVRFHKRAQILVADLWACFDGEGYGRFSDIDKITMFAGKSSTTHIIALPAEQVSRLSNPSNASLTRLSSVQPSVGTPYTPTETDCEWPHLGTAIAGYAILPASCAYVVDDEYRLQYLVRRAHPARNPSPASGSHGQRRLDRLLPI